MSTPIHTLHPRRLFCTEPSEVDATSCLRPSVIAQQERMALASPSFFVQPLLAPSPIASSGLTLDVDTLVDFVNGMSAFPDDQQTHSCGSVKLKQLEPLRDALIALQRRLMESSSTIVGVTPMLSPKEGEKPNILYQEKNSPVVPTSTHHPDPPSIVNLSVTSDVEHLRTIQKALRGLFDARIHSSTQSSLSPIEVSSHSSIQTATGISRALNDSGTVMSSVNCNDDLANLTLSPTTELFDRESIQRNPWFKNNPKRNALPVTRDIPFDGSKTAEALQNARVGTNKQQNHRNDLIQWLQKHATNSNTPTTSAKGLASIYSTRNKADFGGHDNNTPLYRN